MKIFAIWKCKIFLSLINYILLTKINSTNYKQEIKYLFKNIHFCLDCFNTRKCYAWNKWRKGLFKILCNIVRIFLCSNNQLVLFKNKNNLYRYHFFIYLKPKSMHLYACKCYNWYMWSSDPTKGVNQFWKMKDSENAGMDFTILRSGECYIIVSPRFDANKIILLFLPSVTITFFYNNYFYI